MVLFLFGVMSQTKIWKIVRERKAKNAAAREQEAERREQRDSAIGKKVEKHNSRSLAQWEAVYGDKSKINVNRDSGVGTSLDGDGKNSASVATRDMGSIEMDDIGGMTAKRSSRGFRSTVMVHTGGDEEPLQENRELELNLDPEERLWWEDFQSTKSQSKPATVKSVDESSLNEMLLPNRPPVPGGPAVVPLPFAPGDERSEGSATTPKSKGATEKSVNERRGVALNKLALQNLEQAAPSTLARIDDDRASSVAATADFDNRSNYRNSLAPTILLDNEKLSPFSDEFREDVPRSPSRSRTPMEDPLEEDDDDEMVVRPAPQIIEPAEELAKRKSKARRKRRSSVGSGHRATGSVGSINNDAASQSDDGASVHSLKDHLPESISKIAMAYRTNEWAKHIADADQPEYEADPENEADEAAVQVEVGRPAEATRTLDPAAMAETAPPPELKVSSNPSFRQSKGVPELSRKTSAPAPTPVYAFSRTGSQQSLPRPGSSTSVNQQKRDVRSSSAPLNQQTLLESPLEDDRDTSGLYTDPNLLDQRNTRLSRRTTTTNFNALTNPNLNITSPTSEPPGAFPSTPASTISDPLTADETLTLAERKAAMELGTLTPSSPPPRPTTRPALGRVSSTHNPNLIYDSHQPRRSNTVDTQKQNAMLTQWRTSLQAEAGAKAPAMAEEQARQQMMMQRERAGRRGQKESRRNQTRDSMRDVAMRTGQLTTAHQEAMRRMQAKVKE